MLCVLFFFVYEDFGFFVIGCNLENISFVEVCLEWVVLREGDFYEEGGICFLSSILSSYFSYEVFVKMFKNC